MVRTFALAIALLLCAPAAAQDSCRLCYGDSTAKPGERPLTIEIWTDLNFSKLALTGRQGGSAESQRPTAPSAPPASWSIWAGSR